jgi:hypothetical protein
MTLGVNHPGLQTKQWTWDEWTKLGPSRRTEVLIELRKRAVDERVLCTMTADVVRTWWKARPRAYRDAV